MRKIDIQDLIQLLGMVGIIGSLIFVGLEMRQSQRFALASQQQARMEVWTAMMNGLTESGVGFSGLLKNEVPPESEVAAENWRHSIMWVFENDYLQYSLGLMDDSIWSAKTNRLKAVLSNCEAREIFDLRKGGLRQEFVNLVESFPNECSE